MATMLQARSDIGARLNTADTTRELHGDVDIVSKKVLSELRDLDFAEAVSRLTAQSLVLEAAQRSFAKTAGLSLFSVI
jgi:flagellar hook-associated protein 3 FlgL